MGVEFTFLGVDALDRVLVFWTDKRGAYPEAASVLEDAPADDPLFALLDIEERRGALFFDHPLELEPEWYERAGGDGSLRAGDLPGAWAERARQYRFDLDACGARRISLLEHIDRALLVAWDWNEDVDEEGDVNIPPMFAAIHGFSTQTEADQLREGVRALARCGLMDIVVAATQLQADSEELAALEALMDDIQQHPSAREHFLAGELQSIADSTEWSIGIMIEAGHAVAMLSDRPEARSFLDLMVEWTRRASELGIAMPLTARVLEDLDR